jgi:copper(I)-binding protein
MTISTTERPVARAVVRASGSAEGRRARLVVLAAAVLCGTLAGCSAGQVAQTAGQIPDTPGVDGAVGSMVLDDVFLEAAGTVPTGGSVTLRAALTDQSPQPDRLVAVTTPAAASVELLGPDGTLAAGGIDVPGQGQVDATTGPVLIRLTGLTGSLSPQAIVPVTFDFASAGRVTLGDVPVGTPAQRRG